MRRIDWSRASEAEREAALARPTAQSDAGVAERVRAILAEVRSGGNGALAELTKRFDGVEAELRVPEADRRAAWAALADSDKAVLERAKANIEAFHAPQRPLPYSVETEPGVLCRRLPKALESVGLYVPGGTAPLVSTVLMLAVPAAMAGVARRVMASPPGRDGRIDTRVLAAAHLCGVTDVFAVGGAQAVAALAYGTESVPRCNKIFGPGNAYVAMAKSFVSQEMGGPAVDLPAGPSEVMVVADAHASPEFVAADLLAQAEHDRLAQVVLVTDSSGFADRVERALREQLPRLSRAAIAKAAIANSRIVVAPRGEVAHIIDAYAPEHLILQTQDAHALLDAITNAGSVFIGAWTPESVGDYASGTNHTLPTGGAARAYSGVNLESFYKLVTVQELTLKGLESLGPVVARMADMEGLDAHARAVTLRLEA